MSSPFAYPPSLSRDIQDVKTLTLSYQSATDTSVKNAYLLVIKDKISELQAKAEAYSHSLAGAIASLLPL